MIFQPIPLLLVAAAWYLLITSILMVGQFYLERYFARGVSRKLTAKQLEALAKAQIWERGRYDRSTGARRPCRWSRPRACARTSAR